MTYILHRWVAYMDRMSIRIAFLSYSLVSGMRMGAAWFGMDSNH